jgi:hypothetical protein
MLLHLAPILLALTSTLTLTTANPIPLPNGITTRDDQWDFPDWKGQGQVRTRYINDPYPDLGCLTSSGQWTTNEALCGAFETSWLNNYTFYLNNKDDSACGIDVSTFKCVGGVSQGIFGVTSPSSLSLYVRVFD